MSRGNRTVTCRKEGKLTGCSYVLLLEILQPNPLNLKVYGRFALGPEQQI